MCEYIIWAFMLYVHMYTVDCTAILCKMRNLVHAVWFWFERVCMWLLEAHGHYMPIYLHARVYAVVLSGLKCMAMHP